MNVIYKGGYVTISAPAVYDLYLLRHDQIIKPRFGMRYFLSIQGGGRRNNCFIATDDNEVLAENSHLKMGNLLFNHALSRPLWTEKCYFTRLFLYLSLSQFLIKSISSSDIVLRGSLHFSIISITYI